MALPSPSWWHIQLKDRRVYAPGIHVSDKEFLPDVAKPTRQKILTLYDAGVRFIQLDDPLLTCSAMRLSCTSVLKTGEIPMLYWI